MKRFSLEGFSTLYPNNQKYLPNIQFKNTTILNQVIQFVEEDISKNEIMNNDDDLIVKSTDRENISSIEKFIFEDGTIPQVTINIEDNVREVDHNVEEPNTLTNPSFDDTSFLENEEESKKEEKAEEVNTEQRDQIEEATEIFSLLENTLNSELQFTNVSELINSANMLGNKLNTLYSILSTELYDETNDLQKQIVETRDDYIKKNGHEAIITEDNGNDSNIELKANIIDWKEINTLGTTDEIMNTSKQMGNLHNSNNLLTITNSRMTIKNWKSEIVNIDIPEEVKSNVVDTIKSRVPENISKEQILSVLTNLTINNNYKGLLNKLNTAMYAAQPGKDIPMLLDTFKTYSPILRAFQKGDINISNRDTDNIKENATNVFNILQCVALYTMSCRKLFQSTEVLILAEDIINDDVLQTFKLKNGKEEDIVKHIRMKYKKYNQPIPNMGVRSDEIIKFKDNVFKEYNSYCLAVKSKSQEIKNHATLYAYKQVLTNYLKNVDENKIPSYLTRDSFVNFNIRHINKSATHLHSSNSSIEDCLYNFLLDTWYSNTPALKSMYTKLSNKYSLLASEHENGEINEEDKATATAEALIDMTIEFMFKNFIEKS